MATKIVIFLVLCGLMIFVTGQSVDNTAGSVEAITLSPEDEALQYGAIILDIIAKRLALANLSPELESSGQQVLADAADGLTQCEDSMKTTHLVWLYKVCASAQLRIALNAIRALQLASVTPVAVPLI